MSIEQRVSDVFVDFDALIGEGLELKAAITEAAFSNGLSSEALENRLARSGPIEARVNDIREGMERAKFHALLDGEVVKAKSRTGAYARIFLGMSEKVSETLESVLQRPLTEHELWMVEEKVSPWISEWELARAAGSTPLRQFSLDK